MELRKQGSRRSARLDGSELRHGRGGFPVAVRGAIGFLQITSTAQVSISLAEEATATVLTKQSANLTIFHARLSLNKPIRRNSA